MSSRITIRLGDQLECALTERRKQTGQSITDVLRSALAVTLASDSPPPSFPDVQLSQPQGASDGYIFPRELEDFLRCYRGFGMEIWPERRRCFGRLLAACEAARGHSKNVQDRALCAEILRIGRLYGLLPK